MASEDARCATTLFAPATQPSAIDTGACTRGLAEASSFCQHSHATEDSNICRSASQQSGTPDSMPGTYQSSSASELHDVELQQPSMPPSPPRVPPLVLHGAQPPQERVRGAVAELQASAQASAAAALRHASATNAALAAIDALTARLDEHRHGQAFADAALDGAAESQAELKDVIADLHAQLLLARREAAAGAQMRGAQAAELRAVKERLAHAERDNAALQARGRSRYHLRLVAVRQMLDARRRLSWHLHGSVYIYIV
jgi:hypothetical protein